MAGAIVVAAVAGSTVAAPGAQASPRFELAAPVVPTTLTVGSSADVTGRIKHWKKTAGLRIRLQMRSHGQSTDDVPSAWVVVDNEQAKHSAFSLSFTPTSTHELDLRLQLTRRGAVLATSPRTVVDPHRAAGTQAKTPCATAATPPIPAGQGALIGGIYTVGGPAPGVDQCATAPSSLVIVSADTGQVVATIPVAGPQEYVATLAPGSYSLSAGSCTGTATITAGMVTRADTYCNVP